MTFDAPADCEPLAGGATGSCLVRVRIGGNTAIPDNGPFAELTSIGDVGTREQSIQRSRGPLGPGTYPIVVLHRVTDPNMYFGLYGFSMTIERIEI